MVALVDSRRQRNVISFRRTTLLVSGLRTPLVPRYRLGLSLIHPLNLFRRHQQIPWMMEAVVSTHQNLTTAQCCIWLPARTAQPAWRHLAASSLRRLEPHHLRHLSLLLLPAAPEGPP
jgi:23S rRNA A2030 N6-methylase RlmJ